MFPYSEGYMAKIGNLSGVVTGEITTEVTMEVTTEVGKLLKVLKGEMTRQEIQQALGLVNAEHVRKAYIVPALQAGLIEMTMPDTPQRPKQKYRRSVQGEQLL